VRQAADVAGLGLPLATPLASCACPPPTLTEARLLRVQFQAAPLAALPQVAPALLGVVLVLEADHAIVTVPHEADLSPCLPAAPLGGPEVQDRVQGEVGHERPGTAPLRRPCCLLAPGPILPHARLAPLTAVADDTLVPHAVLDNLPQPCVVHRILEATHVGSAYPVAGALFHADRAGIHRLVRAASRAGPVRAAATLWLVHGVEHLDRRPLADVVCPRRRATGALAPSGLRSVDALDRWGLGGAPLQAV
jgi:hypothetical protein